jgi:hypothetical protein
MKFFTKQNFMHDLVTGYVCILLYLTKLVDTWLRRIGSCQHVGIEGQEQSGTNQQKLLKIYLGAQRM